MRPARLTDAGRALLTHAEAVLARLDEAEQELGEIARLRRGRLRLASFPTAIATLVPRAVARFTRRHPDVDVTVIDDHGQDSSYGAIVLHGCRAAGFEPRFAFGSDDYNAVQAFVAVGLGIAVLPRLALIFMRPGSTAYVSPSAGVTHHRRPARGQLPVRSDGLDAQRAQGDGRSLQAAELES